MTRIKLRLDSPSFQRFKERYSARDLFTKDQGFRSSRDGTMGYMRYFDRRNYIRLGLCKLKAGVVAKNIYSIEFYKGYHIDARRLSGAIWCLGRRQKAILGLYRVRDYWVIDVSKRGVHILIAPRLNDVEWLSWEEAFETERPERLVSLYVFKKLDAKKDEV